MNKSQEKNTVVHVKYHKVPIMYWILCVILALILIGLIVYVVIKTRKH